MPAGEPGGGEFGSGGGSATQALSKPIALKMVGRKEQAAALVGSIKEADKSFDGKLTPFLERHPLGAVSVPVNASSDSLLAYSANGAYSPVDQTIGVRSLTQVEWSKDPEARQYSVAALGSREEAQKAVFLHEVGHHVLEVAVNRPVESGASYLGHVAAPVATYKEADRADNLVQKTFRADLKSGAATSEYARTSRAEYFAESFAAYHFSRDRLSPGAVRMVESVMKLASKT